MKTEYTMASAEELTPEIIESIKLAFGNKPIKITVQDVKHLPKKSSSNDLVSKEITDTVIDIIFDQITKKKKRRLSK